MRLPKLNLVTRLKTCYFVSLYQLILRLILIQFAFLFVANNASAANPQSPPIAIPAGLVSGDWADSIALEVGPGFSPLEPRIEIAHQKAARIGLLGIGYQLSAETDVVTKHSATGGVPGHTDDNEYKLNGATLIRQGTSSDGDKERYRLAYDATTSIEYSKSSNSWTIKRDGLTKLLGNGGDPSHNAVRRHRIAGLRSQPDLVQLNSVGPFPGSCTDTHPSICTTTAWFLSVKTDAYGNQAKHYYTEPDLPASIDDTWSRLNGTRENLLTKIAWFHGSSLLVGEVNLIYADRPDPRISYQDGNALIVSKRLMSIKASINNKLFSHYEFRYQDQDSHNCDGEVQSTDTYQRLTLLRRVLRIDVETGLSRTMRCITTYHKQLARADWDTPTNAGNELMALSLRAGNHLIPININGDGKTDLVYISSHSATSHRALVSSGNAKQAFSASETKKGVRAWNNLLKSVFSVSFLNNKGSWILSDFNRDGYSDLLHARFGATAQASNIRLYSAKRDYFYDSPQDLSHCDLKYADATDIDGDGFVDLAIKPHAGDDDCPRESSGRWLRNMGKTPWFNPGNNGDAWSRLAVPHSNTVIQIGGGTNYQIDGVQVEPPFGAQAWERPIDFVMTQARFVDVNTDGIADIVFNLHRAWRKLTSDDASDYCDTLGSDNMRCQWRAVAGTDYSRIFFGNGYGQFINSQLTAGAPTLGSRNGVSPYFSGFNQYQDLNRSGFPDLISSDSLGTLLKMHHYNGVAYGFESTTVDESDSSTPLPSPANFPFAPHPYAEKQPCNSQYCRIVMGDFDGDGFTDILQFKKTDSPTNQIGCGPATTYCATVRFSRRDTAEGRVIASDGPWGGQTELDWQFIGESNMNEQNPNMTGNPEVLISQSDSDGRHNLRYERAVFESGGFKGFPVAQVADSNGAKIVAGTSFTSLLERRPLYRARYHRDGTLQRADIFVYGQYDEPGGYSIATRKDGFNPLIRTCEYELEQQTDGSRIRLGQVIQDCWSWNNRTAPAHSTLLALGSHWRYAINTSLNAAFWDPGSLNFNSLPLTSLSEGDIHEYAWLSSLPISPARAELRWPATVSLPTPIDPELRQTQRPSSASGNGFIRFVNDIEWDVQTRQAIRIHNHRDTRTTSDDRIVEQQWELLASANGYRKTQVVEYSADGIVQSSYQVNSFSGFDDATVEVECGSNGEGCQQIRSDYDNRGNLTATANKTAAWREQWRYDPICGLVLFQNRVEQTEETKYDLRCRAQSRMSNGITYDYEYDGFNRVQLERIEQAGLGPQSITSTYYDDVLDNSQDTKYVEPRVVSVANGAMTSTYLDDFGRVTRTTTCEPHQVPTVRQGDLKAECHKATVRINTEHLYANNGEILANARPYFPSTEEPIYQLSLDWDTAGRPTETYSPNPDSDANSPWSRTLTWYAPGRDIVKDALGRIQRQDASTLKQSRKMAGQVIESRSLDNLSRLTRLINADGIEYQFSYDARSRIKQLRRTGKLKLFEVGRDSITEQEWIKTFRYSDRDQVTRVGNPDGSAVDYLYDKMGRVVKKTHVDIAANATIAESFSYSEDESHGTTTMLHTDVHGGVSTEIVDGFGRIHQESLPNGYTINYSYDTENRQVVKQTTGGTGRQTETRKFDIYGFQQTLDSPTEPPRTFTYTGSGSVARESMSGSATIERKYNAVGQLEHEWLSGSEGRWLLTGNQYDAVGRLVERLENGVTTLYEYDDLDRLTSIVEGAKQEQRSQSLRYIAASDKPAERTLSLGSKQVNKLRYQYDDWGNLIAQSDLKGVRSSRQYDINGYIRQTTDENGLVSSRVMDSFGQIRSTTGKNQSVMRLDHDRSITYQYLHAQTQQTTPTTVTPATITRMIAADGSQSQTVTDAANRVVASVGPQGAGYEYVYDGPLLTDIWLIGTQPSTTVYQRTHYRYDNQDRVTAIFGPSDPAAFAANEPVSAKNYNGPKVVYERDSYGHLLRINANDVITENRYNQAGLLISETHGEVERLFNYTRPSSSGKSTLRLAGFTEIGIKGSSRNHQFSFDSIGRLTKTVSRDDLSVVERLFNDFDFYDNPKLRTRTVQSSRASRMSSSIAELWTYDVYGRPVERITDASQLGKLSSAWSWYENGQLKSETGISGHALHYQYDFPNSDKLKRVFNPKTQTSYVQPIDTNDLGQPVHVKTTDSNYFHSFQPGGRLLSTRITDSTGTKNAQLTYTYRSDGKIKRQDLAGKHSNQQHEFAYDDHGFLQSELLSNDNGTYAYRYENLVSGARSATYINNSPSTDVTYQTDTAERIQSVNGSAIQYNAWLDVVTDQRAYEYLRDASGEVAGVSANGQTLDFLRDTDGKVLAAIDRGAKQYINSWSLDDYQRPLEIQTVAPNGSAVTQLHVSALGAELNIPLVSVLKNADSLILDLSRSQAFSTQSKTTPLVSAFGEIVQGSNLVAATSFNFAGLQSYENFPGIYFSHHRVYDAQTGQFLRTDPVGLLGGDHRRLYANANPVSFFDPEGYWACAIEPFNGGGLNLDDMLDDIMNRFDFPAMEFGSGNSQYDLTQMELAMGIEAIDYSWLSDIDLTGESDFCGGIHCDGGDFPGSPGSESDELSPFASSFANQSRSDNREKRQERRSSRRDSRQQRRDDRQSSRQAKRDLRRWTKINNDYERSKTACANHNVSACRRQVDLLAWYFGEGKRPSRRVVNYAGSRVAGGSGGSHASNRSTAALDAPMLTEPRVASAEVKPDVMINYETGDVRVRQYNRISKVIAGVRDYDDNGNPYLIEPPRTETRYTSTEAWETVYNFKEKPLVQSRARQWTRHAGGPLLMGTNLGYQPPNLWSNAYTEFLEDGRGLLEKVAGPYGSKLVVKGLKKIYNGPANIGIIVNITDIGIDAVKLSDEFGYCISDPRYCDQHRIETLKHSTGKKMVETLRDTTLGPASPLGEYIAPVK